MRKLVGAGQLSPTSQFLSFFLFFSLENMWYVFVLIILFMPDFSGGEFSTTENSSGSSDLPF